AAARKESSGTTLLPTKPGEATRKTPTPPPRRDSVPVSAARVSSLLRLKTSLHSSRNCDASPPVGDSIATLSRHSQFARQVRFRLPLDGSLEIRAARELARTPTHSCVENSPHSALGADRRLA